VFVKPVLALFRGIFICASFSAGPARRADPLRRIAVRATSRQAKSVDPAPDGCRANPSNFAGFVRCLLNIMYILTSYTTKVKRYVVLFINFSKYSLFSKYKDVACRMKLRK
jgi:hypothetical protein